jgi:hypothetical protein
MLYLKSATHHKAAEHKTMPSDRRATLTNMPAGVVTIYTNVRMRCLYTLLEARNNTFEVLDLAFQSHKSINDAYFERAL